MPSPQDCLKSGLDFVEFLGDRTSTTCKKELRDIYNLEFKNRDGNIYPNFSAVINALQKFNRVYIKKGRVYIHVKSQVRFHNGDQWRRPPVGQKGTPGTPTHPVVVGARSSTTSSGFSSACGPVTSVLTPRKRLAKEVLNLLKMNRKELTSDKGGIVITSDPAVTGRKIQVRVDRLGKLSVVKFHILNTGKADVLFTLYTALHRMSCFSLLDERRVTRTSPLLLRPGESYQVEAQYRLHHYGLFPTTMYFEFCPDQPGSKPFCILREMEAWARGTLGVELGPVEPYRPYQQAIRRPVNTVIVEGEPPESSVFHRLRLTVKLGDYIYPFYLKDLSRRNMEDSEYLSNAARQKLASLRALLSSPLKMKNYSQRFHLLLHLEEIQMEVDIRRYDLRGQTMTQDRTNKKLLILQVPGVAENRPSVLRGDCLKVSQSEDKVQPITVYTGYVHRVELDRVKMGFSKRLLQVFLGNMKFDVEFTLNRYSLKLQHRAVDLAVQHRLKKLLFPWASPSIETPLPKLRMFNRQLENNPEQHAAIQYIVAGTSKPAPYLVFGPPGTGKTITLVEAITQVDRADPKAHILACAPSNSASDLLCERLLGHMDPHRIHRLYASSRAPGTVPKHLLRHCNWDATQDSFVFPAKKVLMQYKVIVTTLVTAGRLVSGGIPAGHFSHVFVDEAGQAVEAECVIAVAGLLQAGEGQLVLAGDPQQLGPILRSPLALQHGLDLSLLERLMKHNPLYQKTGELGQYNRRFVTKLLQNYRSHPAILKIPNQLFYDNELQVFADQWERDTYRNWEYLPKKGFPVIFHGVMGKDEREANSPSFFNVSEIEVLVDYLTKLMETQGKKGLPKLSPRDIGIIAPYRKQVEKIQKALKSVKKLNHWNDIQELKVGSVEEFQGQERKIVMVTTVRSSINYVKMDQDFNIGFLANQKRFNVAITRAKALLIVVGNPVILNKDPTWEKFIRYCMDNEGCAGFNHADAEVEDDVVSRLASLKIHAQSESESCVSQLQQHVHPEWRRDH